MSYVFYVLAFCLLQVQFSLCSFGCQFCKPFHTSLPGDCEEVVKNRASEEWGQQIFNSGRESPRIFGQVNFAKRDSASGVMQTAYYFWRLFQMLGSFF